MKAKDLIPAVIAVALVAGALLVWLGPWSGQPAPSVMLRTLDGRQLDLATLEGQPVLVQFWATTCVTCVAEMPELKALHHQLADSGLAIVGVAMSYDPPKQVARMARAKALPYTIALDRDGSVADAFGNVRLTPTTVLIDPHGRVVWKRMGELDFPDLASEIRDLANRNARS